MTFLNASKYAAEMHEGQKRKEGSDYIMHPIAVAVMLEDSGYGMDYLLTGLFHDLLEDTNAKEEDILSLSNEKVLDAVKYLTKTPNYNMDEYVKGISSNEIATIVKLADIIHNLETAIHTSEAFRNKYVIETQKYYLPLVKGTKFEERMIKALDEVIKSLEK